MTPVRDIEQSEEWARLSGAPKVVPTATFQGHAVTGNEAPVFTGKKCRVSLVNYTPELAVNWLENFKYDRQRDLDEQDVKNKAAAITNGKFSRGTQFHVAYLKGNPVHGFLINGMHRSWAVIESGRALEITLLETWCDTMEEINELYYREDMQKPRGLREVVRALNLPAELNLPESFLRSVAAACRFITDEFRFRSRKNLTNDLLQACLKEWQEEARIFFSLSTEAGPYKMRFYRASVLSIAMVLLRHSRQLAVEFWKGVFNDEGLQKGDPRKTLREFVITSLVSANIRGKKSVHDAHMARTVASAWNSWHKGQKLERIQRARDYDSPIALRDTPYKGDR